MSLIQDHTYLLSGRLICPNVKTAPVLYYEQDLTFPMGSTESLPISLSNKTAVWGFGIIISKQEREDSAIGQASFQSLFVVMKHTDYDNQVRSSISVYTVRPSHESEPVALVVKDPGVVQCFLQNPW